MITVSKLAPGDRVYAVLTDDGPVLAKQVDGAAQVVTVEGVGPAPTGRKLRIATDRGDIDAGPTARVLLAPPADPEPESAPEPAPIPAPDPAAQVGDAPARIVAVATVDHAGRLTHASTLTVGTDTRPVPARVDAPAGAFAPVRLGYVLREMGYRRVGRWAAADPGHVSCVVEPVSADDTE